MFQIKNVLRNVNLSVLPCSPSPTLFTCGKSSRLWIQGCLHYRGLNLRFPCMSSSAIQWKCLVFHQWADRRTNHIRCYWYVSGQHCPPAAARREQVSEIDLQFNTNSSISIKPLFDFYLAMPLNWTLTGILNLLNLKSWGVMTGLTEYLHRQPQ